MSELLAYFEQNKGRLMQKWLHYFEVYERHFERYRGKDIVVLEIGVSQGGSLQMWKNYFGPRAKIWGIDINPQCKAFEEENIQVLIGSQSDRDFLREVKRTVPKFDILIDDGGHTMEQQIVTYEELFEHIKDDGVYLCEDLHTSYQLDLGGGHKRRSSYIEYSKNFIDQLNAYHAYQGTLKVTNFTKTVKSLHYYDSMLVIEKGLREKPYQERRGDPSFPINYGGTELWAGKPFLLKLKPYLFRIAEFLARPF